MQIRKAAVIGAGTMGSGIAALLAGAGIETLLLDIPAAGTDPTAPPEQRSAPVRAALERLRNARPPQLLDESDLSQIQAGNVEDDLARCAGVDWVVEAVFERLDIKQELMAKLAVITPPTTIVSTNTSGLLLRDIAANLPDEFTRRFVGTHFFNPPRQLHLLELIPHPNTDTATRQMMEAFAADVLGKGVVWCKDTPNFIGNRFYTMLSAQLINTALEMGFTVAEIDALTGMLIGRPRTATFRLQDLVGIDVAAHIRRNLYPAIPDDPAREMLQQPQTNTLFDQLIARDWLGSKRGQGFYKMVKDADGSKQFWALDLATLEYRLPPEPQFDCLSRYGQIEDTAERIRLILSAEDRAAVYLRQHFAFYLAYASRRVPEITDSLANIDRALKWGFGHELGAFEIWDALGVADTLPQFEAAGFPAADWVKQMLDQGRTHFYDYDSDGAITGWYDVLQGHSTAN